MYESKSRLEEVKQALTENVNLGQQHRTTALKSIWFTNWRSFIIAEKMSTTCVRQKRLQQKRAKKAHAVPREQKIF